MQFIPIHVIAFFMAIMMVPKDVNQFTIAVQGKEIQWTRQEAGWHAVELPRDDWGTYSVAGTEVTITGEGHKLKTNISRFLTLPENLDWKKAAEIQVALKSLGDPVQIKRADGKIVLSQAKGVLFQKPATISWKVPGKTRAHVVGGKDLQKAGYSAAKEIKGYPVYKFVTLGGIDSKAFKANEAETRKFLGENYDAFVKQHQLLVSRGFDLHTPLKIQIETGKEIDVFVRTKDYESLWKVSPHDLAKQKKSHLVTIKYIEVKVGGETLNRAVSFESELVEREPIIRK
jgi:hypothetical protein